MGSRPCRTLRALSSCSLKNQCRVGQIIAFSDDLSCKPKRIRESRAGLLSVVVRDPLKNIYKIVKNHAYELNTMYQAGSELEKTCGQSVEKAKTTFYCGKRRADIQIKGVLKGARDLSVSSSANKEA